MLEFFYRFGVARRATEIGQFAGLAARREDEPIVVADQQLGHGFKQPIGTERCETPIAAGVAAFHLMELPSRSRRHNEIDLVDSGNLYTKSLCFAIEHEQKLVHRPPCFIAIADFCCRSTWEHYCVSQI